MATKLWLKASSISGSDGDAVGTWPDLSGFGNNFTQATAGNKPTLKTNIVNGLAVVRFDGFSADYLTGPDLLSGATAGEAFIVVKIDTEPPGATDQSGLWNFSTSDFRTFYPYHADGVIYDNFGTTLRKTTVNPTPALSSWRLYNVSTASGAWTSRLDGTQIFTTATNTVSFVSAPTLGRSYDGQAIYLDGDVAEFVVFDEVLSAAARSGWNGYFANRFALTIANSDAALLKIAPQRRPPTPASTAPGAVYR